MKFKSFLILFMVFFAAGFYLFKFAVSFTILKSATTPWIMLTLLLFSASYCIQALFKLPESDEHPSLTSNELRRLRPAIIIKKRRLVLVLVYHIVSGVIVALGFFSINTTNPFFPVFFSLTGAMVLSCLFTFAFIKSNMDEIQQFKSLLIHRAESEKRKQEVLNAMSKKPE